MYYIGIDLGGTNIAVGVVTEDGKILETLSVPTRAERDYTEIIADMAEVSKKVCEKADYLVFGTTLRKMARHCLGG